MWLINGAGLALIGLIVWWFWLYRPPAVAVAEAPVIRVEQGTYQPARLRVPANQPVSLTFLRRDVAPCSEWLLIPSLDISRTLPLDEPVRIELPPLAPGEYPFHCQMQMYRGTLVAG